MVCSSGEYTINNFPTCWKPWPFIVWHEHA